jgi:hypothetical protein
LSAGPIPIHPCGWGARLLWLEGRSLSEPTVVWSPCMCEVLRWLTRSLTHSHASAGITRLHSPQLYSAKASPSILGSVWVPLHFAPLTQVIGRSHTLAGQALSGHVDPRFTVASLLLPLRPSLSLSLSLSPSMSMSLSHPPGSKGPYLTSRSIQKLK